MESSTPITTSDSSCMTGGRGDTVPAPPGGSGGRSSRSVRLICFFPLGPSTRTAHGNRCSPRMEEHDSRQARS
jgi:hypothetical protein